MERQTKVGNMRAKKPKTMEEIQSLVNERAIEVCIAEELEDGRTQFLICDNRRSYEEGEIYEVIV